MRLWYKAGVVRTCEVWGVRCEVILIEGSLFHNKQVRREMLTAWQIWDITDSQIVDGETFHQYKSQLCSYILCSMFSFSITWDITCYHYSPEYLESTAAPNLSGFIVICKITTSFYLSFRKVVTGPPRSEVVRAKNGIIKPFLSLVFSYYDEAATDLNCQITKFGWESFYQDLHNHYLALKWTNSREKIKIRMEKIIQAASKL